MKNFLILTIISCCLVKYTYTASKYYDGPVIPYKFGYSIENNQHRHEEKDENGQIMGEFGFITADGVYHVTRYATDENGNYKVLFMKNIKIGLPGEPGSQPAPTNLVAEERKEITVPTTKLAPIAKPSFEVKFDEMIPSDIPSCSGCIIPEPKKKESVTKKQKPSLLPASFIRPDVESKEKLPPKSQPVKKISEIDPVRSTKVKTEIPSTGKKISISPKVSPKVPTSVPTYKSDEPAGLDVRVSDKVPSDGRGPIRTVDQFKADGSVREALRPINQIRPDGSKEPIRPGKGGIITATLSPSSQKQLPGKLTDRTGLGRQISPSEISTTLVRVTKPTSVSDVKVSAGVREEDRKRISSGLLYKFNYTVGYHGHHEQGDAVGAKDGGYYFVGRDGYKRTVDYNANEFGFQPHVKLEQANPQEIPQEETEKEAGLKGYEFKWFNI